MYSPVQTLHHEKEIVMGGPRDKQEWITCDDSARTIGPATFSSPSIMRPGGASNLATVKKDSCCQGVLTPKGELGGAMGEFLDHEGVVMIWAKGTRVEFLMRSS